MATKKRLNSYRVSDLSRILSERISLSPAEANFMALLYEHGEVSAREIARALKRPRTSVYSLAQSLQTQGLIAKIPRRDGVRFFAFGAEAFRALLEKERDRLSELEQAIDMLGGMLGKRVELEATSATSIRIIEGEEAIDAFLFESLPEWERCLRQHGNVWWGIQDDVFVKKHFRWLRHHWKRKEKIAVRLFSNDSAIEDHLRNKIKDREIRSGFAGLSIQVTLWIIGDYIILIDCRAAPNVGLELRSSALASVLRAIFARLWQGKA